MHNHQPANYICPLCQIANGQETERGNQKEAVFYQDEFLTAFVAGKWWRTNPGHVIIIPNSHIENIYDLPSDIGHKIFDLSKKVALALKETYACDGVSTRQHNEPAGNQDVWHFHLHVFPRYEQDNFYVNFPDYYWPSDEEKKPYVEKLKGYFQ